MAKSKKSSRGIKSRAINIGGKTHNVEIGSKAEAKYLSQGGTVGTAQDKANRSSYLKSLNDPSSSNFVDPETGLQNGKDFYGNAVTSDLLKPSAGITLPPKPQPADPGNLLALGNASLANQDYGTTLDENGQFIPYQDEKAKIEARQEKNLQDMIKAIGAPVDTARIYEKEARAAGLEQKRQEVQNYSNQLNAIVAKSEADVLSTVGQGRGIPEAIIGGQQAQIRREAAIQALPVQAQLAAAQGNLELAERHVDKMFELKSADARAQYEYKSKVYSMIYDFMDKKEQAKLAEISKKEDRAYQEKQANIDTLNQWAKMAVETGQSDLITSFASINPSSPTFQRDFAKVQSKIKKPVKLDTQTVQYGNGTALINSNTGAVIKVYPGKPLTLSSKELKEQENALKEKTASIPIMQDKIETIDILKDHDGLNSRVGPNAFSRGALAISDAFGAGRDFAGGIHKLVGGLTLQSLIDAKARGATFGALSEGELKILANSASAINDWEIWKKDGKVVPAGTQGGVGIGVWNIDEQSFKRELDAIQNLTRKALILAQGQLFTDDESTTLDSLFNQIQSSLEPSSYYK